MNKADRLNVNPNHPFMSKFNVDPALLADLDNERDFAKSQSNVPLRLKIDKGGKALIRVLPVNLTPEAEFRQWYARVGFHWHNQKPCICPRTTQPVFGGDPNAVCPVCTKAEKYINDRDETIRKMANQASTWPNWLIYCLVWQTWAKNSDEPTNTPRSEQFVPQEFWLRRPVWIMLSDMFKKSLKRVPEFGLLNPVAGYDVMVTKDLRGNMIMTREDDPTTIGEDLKSFDSGMTFVDDIFAKVKVARLTPSTDRELKEFALKLGDSLDGDGPSGVDESEDRRDRRSTSSGRRSTTAREVDDDEPAHARQTRTTQPPLEDMEDHGDRRKPTRDPDHDPEPAPTPTPARRPAPEAPPPTSRVMPPPAGRASPPPAAAGRVVPPLAHRPPPEDLDLDPEDVPPERHDAAPPADPEPPEEAPPSVARTATAPGRLSSSLRHNISALGARK